VEKVNLRYWPTHLRGRLEGVDFLAQSVARRVPASWRRMRSREGLAPFRRAWWLNTRHESYASVRRYARLLDWALAEPGRPRAAREGLPENGRVLVFRSGHLGDVLHLLPTVNALKRQRPDLRLELVTGPWNRSLSAQFDAFSQVHYFTPDVIQFHRGDRGAVLSPAGERAWIHALRADGVDAVFCPSVPHFAELPLIVGAQPARYVGGEWPLAGVPVAFECSTRPFDSRHYELDAVADFLPLLGVAREPVRLAYVVGAESRKRVGALLERARRSELVVFPGSGWAGKCWPAASFAQALDTLMDRMEIDVVLAGSPAEHALCERVRSAMKHAARNMAGALSLDESAALVERAAAVLGNDSAPIHLAAALGRPSVSLWGPTFPEKWAPRGPAHRSVARAGSCAGCTYWHPAAACVGTPPCMATIEVDRVVRALHEVLHLDAANG
jgi:ADP-heptose:LPS heptosyltransferase